MGAFYGKKIRDGKMTLEKVPLYWRKYQKHTSDISR